MIQEYPNCNHTITNADDINIGKLINGGVITIDTCNGEQKTRRLHVEGFKNISEEHNVVKVGLLNNLRNVWFGGMDKQITRNISMLMKDKIYYIDMRLRLSTSMEPLLIAFDKEFRFCANYKKFNGELFCTWMEENHPGFFFLI